MIHACNLSICLILCAIVASQALAADAPAAPAADSDKDIPTVLRFEMNRLDGKEADLADYEGKVLLIVNVASKCGYTRQYKGLQALHEKYAKKGLAILAFPCNQFGRQEPGTPDQIAAFCEDKYGVEFDLFEKIEVKGEGQCDLYKYLTAKKTNPKALGPIKWNFEKFLVGRDGKVIGHYRSKTKPEGKEMVKLIETALEEESKTEEEKK